MRCPRCQADIPPGERFCGDCGAAVALPAPPPPPPPPFPQRPPVQAVPRVETPPYFPSPPPPSPSPKVPAPAPARRSFNVTAILTSLVALASTGYIAYQRYGHLIPANWLPRGAIIAPKVPPQAPKSSVPAPNPTPAPVPPGPIPKPDSTPAPVPHPQPPHTPAPPGEAPWMPMLEGDSLAGWEAFENPEAWSVRGGIVTGQGARSHLFYTRLPVADCEFKALVRINPGGNSGMYFRAQPGPGFPKGYEAQVSNTGDTARTGSLYGLVPETAQLVQDDTWFSQHIVAQGNHITISVNGRMVVNYVDARNTYPAGFIALQVLNPATVVQYRELMLRALGGSMGQVVVVHQ
jgi:hypothetical protein